MAETEFDAESDYDLEAAFVTDDGDSLLVGHAWPDGADRDGMLGVVVVEECTGAVAAVVLSRYQLEELRRVVDKLLE